MKNQHVISRQQQHEQLKFSIDNNLVELEALILKKDELKRDQLTAKNHYDGYSGDKDDPNYQRLADEARRSAGRVFTENLQGIATRRQVIWSQSPDPLAGSGRGDEDESGPPQAIVVTVES